MGALNSILSRFTSERSGAISIIAAVILPVLIGLAALMVDYGLATMERRELQTIADLAAIEAAAQPDKPIEAVKRYLANNNLNFVIDVDGIYYRPDGTKLDKALVEAMRAGTLQVAPGSYSANSALAAADRFRTGAAYPDAVKVTAVRPATLVFASMFSSGFQLAAEGTAAASRHASIGIGTRLASLNGGVINAILGSLTGSTISLSVADYNALLQADIELFQTSKALATNLGLTGVTYDDVLQQDITLPQFLEATQTTSTISLSARTVLSKLERSLGNMKATFRLADFVELGLLGKRDVGSKETLTAYANVLQMVSTAAGLSTGERQIDVGLNVKVPGLAGLRLRLGIGQPMATTPLLAASAPDVTVRTAQIRLLLVARVDGLGSLLGSTIELPLFVEGAKGSATLQSIACQGRGANAATVNVSAVPGLLMAAIGKIDESRFDEFNDELKVVKATLVKTPLASVNGLALIDIENTKATTLRFTPSDVRDRTVKTVSTNTVAASLIASLLSNLQVEINALGLSLSLNAGLLTSGLKDSLVAAAQPIDGALNSVLTLFGMRIGAADIVVSGTYCGGATLVQ